VSDVATLRWAYDEEEAAASKKRRDDETKKREEKNEDERRDKCIILVNTGWTQQERRRLIKLSASHHQRSWLREAGHEADTPRCPKNKYKTATTEQQPTSTTQLSLSSNWEWSIRRGVMVLEVY